MSTIYFYTNPYSTKTQQYFWSSSTLIVVYVCVQTAVISYPSCANSLNILTIPTSFDRFYSLHLRQCRVMVRVVVKKLLEVQDSWFVELPMDHEVDQNVVRLVIEGVSTKQCCTSLFAFTHFSSAQQTNCIIKFKVQHLPSSKDPSKYRVQNMEKYIIVTVASKFLFVPLDFFVWRWSLWPFTWIFGSKYLLLVNFILFPTLQNLTAWSWFQRNKMCGTFHR